MPQRRPLPTDSEFPRVQTIHYDMEDLLEQANEIQESLARSYAVPDELDEADLEAELDALQFEEEEEGSSYLADLNKAPDFIDEPPVEETEVSSERSRHDLFQGSQLMTM